VVGQCSYSKVLLRLRVSSPGNGARCSNTQSQTVRCNDTAAFTDSSERILTGMGTFLSLLNPHPCTEAPPHHVLPVLVTVFICKHAFFGLLCYAGAQPGCPETTLGDDSFWGGKKIFFKKKVSKLRNRVGFQILPV